MASQLEHYLPPTNLNRCRIRTSYRHRESSQEGVISHSETSTNIPKDPVSRQPLPHRVTPKEMEVLLQQPHENSVVGDYNFKTRRHKGIIKNGSVKTKKHVTINLSNHETCTDIQNTIIDKPQFLKMQEDFQDNLNPNKYVELSDDINLQYMEFAKLIKLKEDNVLLKEERLALKAVLTQKDMEIDKYKEIIKKILRKSNLATKDNQMLKSVMFKELITGLIQTLNGEKTRQSSTQNNGFNICPINGDIEKYSAQKDLVNKMSERVRLKRLTMHKKNETVITGADIIQGVKNPAIVKHLMQPLVAKAEWNNVYKTSCCILSDLSDKSEMLKKYPEISTNLDNLSLNMEPEAKFVEEEYLKSKCDRLSAQVEVLEQNLSESKQTADDLALKLSKSECTLNSYQRLYHVTHQTNIILEVLLALKESQLAYSTALTTETNKESAYNSCETCSEEIGFYHCEEGSPRVGYNGHPNRHPTHNSVPYLDIIHHKMKSEQMAMSLLNLVEYRYAKVLQGQALENGQTNFEKSNIKIPQSPQSFAFNSLSSRGSSSTGNSSGHEYSSLENSKVAAKTHKSFSRDNEKRLKTFLRLLKIREKHLQKHSTTLSECQDNINTNNDDQESTFNASYAQYFAERYGAGDLKSNGEVGLGSAEDLIFKSLDIQKFIDNLILPLRDQILMPKSSSYHIYEDPSKCLSEMGIDDCQDAQQLALENSIILLELCETKEQMARLKVQKYHMEKEKNLAEIRLAIKHNLESSLKSQIQSLEKELEETRKDLVVFKDSTNYIKQFSGEMEESVSEDENLKQSLIREYRLRKQIEELMGVVEIISANSEKRYQNSMDVISELKYNNMFLNGKCDKIKRIYETKIKGFQPESGSSENEPLQSDDMNNEETDL